MSAGKQPLRPTASTRRSHAAPSPFDLPSVEFGIAGTDFAGSLQHLPSVSSTQDLALRAAQAGHRRGVWIADEQTAGRGRGSHSWHSPPGSGLYLSALLTPSIPSPLAVHLSLATALAAQTAIADVAGFRMREQIDIRWPNDLILNGRKCGGILIESATLPSAGSAEPPPLRYAVIGVGLNCNHTRFPPELDPIATSLRREQPDGTPPVSREALLAALLRALHEEIARIIDHARHPAAALYTDLERRSSWIRGKRVTLPEAGGYTGVTDGLTPEGFLRVHFDDGRIHIVRSGGVREPSA